MKFKVTEGWQVKYDGTLYKGGQTFEARKTSEVEAWLSAGWVKEVKEPTSTSKK